MKIRVIDCETLKNFFSMVGYDITTKEVRKFVIHRSRNDYYELMDYLHESDGLIGYNIVGFDYPVLSPFLENRYKYDAFTGAELAAKIYKRSQKVISWQDKPKEREWITPIMPLCDLFLIHHFNNKARATSLKWLQVNMNWHNVQEMPYSHDTLVDKSMIQEILSYNENDVMSTHAFYELSKDKIDFRKELSEKFNRNMGNFPDTKIGEQIFLMRLSEKLGIPESELRKGRTHRSEIVVKDCLIEDLHFVSKEFQWVLNEYKGMVIKQTKKQKDTKKGVRSVIFDGVKYDFGFGGLHGIRSNGVYRGLVSADVKSYYPNLAIGQGFYPEHLGYAFCEVYKEIYEERKLYPKKSTESETLKLSLNGTFGASNAPWSPFYDPMFTMRVTLNGQFILAVLCERLTLLRAAKIIQVNTDGIEVEIIDQKKFEKVCKIWEQEYDLELEFAKYNKLCVANVNNYIGVYESGEVKEKGCFETKKLIHKDQSMKIVATAVRAFLVDGVPITKTIGECNDLKQFVCGARAKTGNLRYRQVIGMDLVNEKLPKVVRYYVSDIGGSIVKVTKSTRKKKSEYVISPRQTSLFDVPVEMTGTADEKITNLHVGRKMTLFNRWVEKPFEKYKVDKSFYIQEAQKMINSVNAQATI